VIAPQRGAQRVSQLLAGAVQARSHRVDRELARDSDFVVGQTAGFAQQKDIAIERRKPFERLLKRSSELLRRRRRALRQFDRLAAPAIVANMIERKVPGDAEHPRASASIACFRHRTSRDPQKHLLRELRSIALADDPAEVAEDPISMRGKQDVGVGQHAALSE
jgi:hypothetical protein